MAFTTREEAKRRKEYDAYLASKAWKAVRNDAFRRANFKCEQCGVNHIDATLQVHHLTYAHFKHERPEDVVVLCMECHAAADERRRTQVKLANWRALEDARFEGWAQKVFGDNRGFQDWRDAIDEETAREKYDDWCERRGN